VNAVVMAAGEGRRLRPVTERWPKPVLPIDGRPVIATLVRELAAAGFAGVTVVTGYLADQIERLLGDGSGFGLEISYVRQPSPDGSADTVRRALAAGVEPPLLVVAADTVFTQGDLGRFSAAFSTAGAVASRRDDEGPARLEVEGGRIVRIVDPDPASPLRAAPLWAIGRELIPYLEELPGPPFELAVAFQRAIDAGKTVAALEIGKTRDLTDPLDLMEENFSYLEQRR
jgi:NDP-sugar pyrophosphorylase family protein